MKYLMLFLALLLCSCSVSQFTVYKPSDETQGWKIEVEKNIDSFNLKIDGVSVAEGSYGFLGHQFEAAGTYKDKKVQMFGYRSFGGNNGSHTSHDQIRIIIEDTEVTVFDFYD